MVLFKPMRDKFHKTVLPNDENKGIPLLIQASGAVAVMLLGFAIFAFANFHGYIVNNYAGENYAAVVAAVLIDQTNDEREDEQLPELQPSELLTASAQLKADDMARDSYFAHVSPDGLSPWYWFEQAGYRFSFAGENLAVNFRDSGSVTRAWMNSPTHRANIVNGNYQEIGIATARGRYKGKNTTYVAQHFGTPYVTPYQFDFSGLVGREVTPAEQEVAINEAREFLAAAADSNAIEKLLVQPDKIYSYAYLLLSLLVLVIGINAYVSSESRQDQKNIVLYSAMILIVLAALGLATLELLNTEVIAGTII